jgi:NAD(P)-dependent dehydrogenase (short-subunit alcohol dehydrogenase family)
MIEGKRILVTGAARGIGLAVAEAAVAAGAGVVLADIDGDLCQEAAERIGAHAITMDVGDAGSVSEGVAAAASRLGGLDGVVNNAAILDDSETETVSDVRFAEILSVNLTSILRVSQAALSHLAGHGSIVNTLSTQAFFAQPGAAAYAAAKGGGLNLTRALALDFAPHGVRVNAVAPGFINTRMAIMPDGRHEHETDLFRNIYVGRRRIPLARAGKPAECAGAFLFFLSDAASYVTGQCLVVDGGLTTTY